MSSRLGTQKACFKLGPDAETDSRSGEVGFGKFVIRQVVEEVGHIVGPPVAEVDVVAVFPDIEAQQRRALSCSQRVHAVRCFGDGQCAIGFLDQPCPAGAELTDGCGLEIGLELLDRTEGIDNLAFEFTRDAATPQAKVRSRNECGSSVGPHC